MMKYQVRSGAAQRRGGGEGGGRERADSEKGVKIAKSGKRYPNRYHSSIAVQL